MPTTEVTPATTVTLGVMADFTIAGRSTSLLLEVENSDNGFSLAGSTETGQSLPLSALIEDIAAKYGGKVTLPSLLSDLTIDQLSLSYRSTGAFSFICDTKLAIDGRILEIQLQFQFTKQPKGGYAVSLSGKLALAGLEFELYLGRNQTSNFLIATYTDKTNQGIKLKNLVGCVSADLASCIPESLELNLKNIAFAYNQPVVEKNQNNAQNGQSKNLEGGQFFFGIRIDTYLGLSDLPLIGKKLPPEYTIELEGVQLLIASRSIDQPSLDSLKTNPVVAALLGSIKALPPGVNLSASMKFGTERFAPFLPLLGSSFIDDRAQLPSSNASQPQTSSGKLATTPAKASTPAVPDDSTFSFDSKQFILWYKLQKAIGPVVFKRIGIQYKEEKIWLLPDIGLASSSLRIELAGLAVGFGIQPLMKGDFSQLKPEFRLQGIAIHYKSASVEIGGAFLRTVTEIKDAAGKVIKTREEYSGAAIIKTKAFGIAAIGSYTELDGHPSIFVYAFLSQSLGGPPFFFITGLAAGFGYNRDLIVPSLDEIPQFPLVKLVMGDDASNSKQDDGDGILGILSSLQTYIPPAPGKYFLALGVKFTSFKLIDSFALLIITFGDRFQVRLLGISKIVAPPSFTGLTPIAEIQIGLRVEFDVDEGCLKVEGKVLPGSYLFSRDCKLSGGFAFYAWFMGEHAGDFVLTVGGYHPNFKVPAHYPKVDRLALNWQVNQSLSIKGEAYFALTSAAIMAGGNLEARYKTDDLSASFKFIADFLLAWQPYYYDIRLSIEIRAKYCTTLKDIDVSVSADLHLWGPEFSGKVHIDLDVISFDVEFGEQNQQKPDPIDWKTFKTAFLPAEHDLCRVAAGDGLIKTLPEGSAKRWVINPKDFKLTTESAIPIKQAYFAFKQVLDPKTPRTFDTRSMEVFETEAQTDFGISSMDVRAEDLRSEYAIQITRNNEPCHQSDFKFEPITKNVPSALWGTTLEPDPNGQLVSNVLTGFHIKPGQPPKPGQTSAIDCSNLTVKLECHKATCQWEKPIAVMQQDVNPKSLLQALEQMFECPSEQINVSADSPILQELLAALKSDSVFS